MTEAPVTFKAPRPLCKRCLRPKPTCYCAYIQPVATHTRFVILMHEDERRRRIATGRMSFLSLNHCELLIGNDIDHNRRVRALIEAGPCYLLYPGEQAIACGELTAGNTRTIFVVDGKWSHSRKLLRNNPRLAKLPRISFRGSYESWFTIKKQPHPRCLSTLEAIVYTIVELPDENPVEALKLLPPYFHVINQQLAYEIHNNTK